MPNHGNDGWQPTQPAPTTQPPAVVLTYKVPTNLQMALSLRDYFAARSIDAAYHHCRKTGPWDPKRIAEFAYQLADAMMEETDGK